MRPATERVTENQRIRPDMIEANAPQLYRAYSLKESLRILLKSTDVEQTEADLRHWLWWASHSRIPASRFSPKTGILRSQ
ncbi:MAG: transposase [Bilifractor sp.]